MLRIFTALTLLLSALYAEPAAVEANKNLGAEKIDAKPSIVKLDNGMMQIGLVTFDPRSRQVRVPCTVNMTEGQIEYAVVNEKGKIHEALLCTKASPTDVNVACKLLRYVTLFSGLFVPSSPQNITPNCSKIQFGVCFSRSYEKWIR